jgi:hypothetical protein
MASAEKLFHKEVNIDIDLILRSDSFIAIITISPDSGTIIVHWLGSSTLRS